MTALKLSFVGICVFAACQTAFADSTIEKPTNQESSLNTTSESSLDTIHVSADGSQQILEKKVGETVKTAKTLSKQQTSDSRDLVRYETGISVVETGRSGASGYAVRGVDENRVGIMIDGLRQAETLSSQGFKELFEGYGNFNNTRNGVEIENVKQATITKGSDSMKAGSGALGGSVIFDTKDARDFLTEKDYHLGLKRGYNSANSQDVTTFTAAGRYKWFDILVINTKRDGHEIKNFGYDDYNDKVMGKKREKADPYRIRRDSTLVKFGFQPSENHRFSVALDDSTLKSNGQDLSYTLRTSRYTDEEKYGQRLTNDKSKRKNLQFAYETFAQTPFWDHVKITYSTQKITNTARTDEYCYTNDCVGVLNPQGLHLDSSGNAHKLVDKFGGEIKAEADTSGWYTVSVFKNSKGETLAELSDYRTQTVNSTFIDCSKLDCNKPFNVFISRDEEGEDIYQFQPHNITIKSLPNGQKYGEIIPKAKDEWSKEKLFFVFPRPAGYMRNDYNDRDLNTDTHQINLDFDKEFSLGQTHHALKYGGLLSKTKKSMVNKDGYQGGNEQWWATDFFCNERTDQYDENYNAIYRPRPDLYPVRSCTGELRASKANYFSYLIPVKTHNSAFYFGDNMQLTNWLGLDLNYRFDKITHKPGYDQSVPVPKGLLAGVMKKLPADAVTYGIYANCGYNSDCMNQNVAENLSLLLREKVYKHHSYNIGLNLDPTDWMRFQVKYANGFRAPTSDEIYMTFKHPSFSIGPNTNLKAEKAATKEAALTFYREHSFITFSAFRTDYKDFIDLVFDGERPVEENSAIFYPFYQNQNRDRAKVTGIEVNALLQLGDISKKLSGFRMGYKLTHQKGRVNGDIPMNAIQPTTSVYNLGYSTEDDKYGIDFFVTDVSAKKAQDTYNMYWESQSKNPNRLVQGKPVTDSKVAWRSGHYTIIDAIVYAKPIKNLTLTAGIYNLTNQKYLTWDSARSIRAFGTINQIDQNTGAGINRFYAPGRNFRLTGELTF